MPREASVSSRVTLARTAEALAAYDVEYERYLQVASNHASNAVLDFALGLLHKAERAIGEAYARDTVGKTSFSAALLVGDSAFVRRQVREWKENFGKP